MGNCGSTSSDLAKGREFAKQLLYVQHVDEEKPTASKMSEELLLNYILEDHIQVSRLNLNTPNLSQSNSNFDILKSSVTNEILQVSVYSNPLPIHSTLEKYSFRKMFKMPNLPAWCDVAIHAFVVLKTLDPCDKRINWWSMEKNGKYIILQQSSELKQVCERVYDVEKEKTVKRLGPVKELTRAISNHQTFGKLFQSFWKTNQLNQTYHVLSSNCQNFASFVFEKANGEGKKWSTAIRGFWRKETINPLVINVDTVKHYWIIKNDKFPYYKALIENKSLAEIKQLLTNYYTAESIHAKDAQGYTLLEWAEAFSRDDIKRYLMTEKGAVQSETFKQNVFFVILQYWNFNRKMKNFNKKMLNNFGRFGVNRTKDTALHLALHGAKWTVVDKILSDSTNDDVNSINSLGETPLHLAAKLKLRIDLFRGLLNRTDPENVNKVDTFGYTPLHWATSVNLLCNDKIKLLLDKGANINAKDSNNENTPLHCALVSRSIVATEILLKYVSKDASNILDVNIGNKRKQTALHYGAAWPTIPVHLFKLIVDKSTDVNVQEQNGNTPLNVALMNRSQIATENLLKLQTVDINTKNIQNATTLHHAAQWPDISVDLFKLILEKSVDINAQTFDTNATALHVALFRESVTATEGLLKHVKLVNGSRVEDADVNIKDVRGLTALHMAAKWAQIPPELFKIILEKSSDINAQSSNRKTALHFALLNKSETATRELLKHVKCVDGVNVEDTDVNIKDSREDTALHLAASWEDIPDHLFQLIQQKSTEINAQNEQGETPLHLALFNQSKTAIEELLTREDELDFNIKSFNNQTAVHCAAYWKDIPLDFLHKILDKTTDIKARNTYGDSPLLIALWNSSVHVSEELLHRLLLLGEGGSSGEEVDFTEALYLAANWSDIPENLFKKILDQSTDINAKNQEGNTALHIALFKKSKTATEQLLNHVKCEDGTFVEDVDVNLKGLGDNTALHLAVQWSDIPFQLFDKILGKSADVTAKNLNDKTPAQLAEECQLNMRAIRLLRRRVNVLCILPAV